MAPCVTGRSGSGRKVPYLATCATVTRPNAGRTPRATVHATTSAGGGTRRHPAIFDFKSAYSILQIGFCEILQAACHATASSRPGSGEVASVDHRSARHNKCPEKSCSRPRNRPPRSREDAVVLRPDGSGLTKSFVPDAGRVPGHVHAAAKPARAASACDLRPPCRRRWTCRQAVANLVLADAGTPYATGLPLAFHGLHRQCGTRE